MTDAAWVRAARETLGLTQQQLADALHIRQPTVSQIESGVIGLSRRTRAQIGALLREAREITLAG